MSDVSDFAGVSSGATTLLASGSVNAAFGGSFSLTAQNIPATVRAILLLVLPTATTNNAETYSVPVAKGNVSQVQWRPIGLGSGWPADGQGVGVITAGVAMSPLYFPFYGLVDTAVTVSWAINGGGSPADQVEYWMVGLPDPDIAGSTLNPFSVTNGINPSTGVPTSLDVTLVQKDTQNGVGNLTAPFAEVPAVMGSGNFDVLINTTGVGNLLLAAPAAGVINVIDVITVESYSGAMSCILHKGGQGFARTQGTGASSLGSVITGPIYQFSANGNVTAAVSAAGTSCIASGAYHTIPQP